jgi:hypothetical protein
LIGKVLRGKRVEGLIRYLYGPGRLGEHHDPRIVAGFDEPGELEPPIRPDGSRDFRRLDGLLSQPLALLGERNYRKPVWHLALRAAPEDPILDDHQWAEIAKEMMARTGLAADEDDDAVRWIAVRHGEDHIHVVATLARIDGVRPDVWNDGYRIRDACRAIEQRFGLRSTAPADRTAARRPKRAEAEKAARSGREEPVRVTLWRQVAAVAAGARTEADFFAALEAEGVLVRKRYSTRFTDQVTGYAVALPDDLASSGQPVWFGGGKLAGDLTLPKLRLRWGADGAARPLGGRHVSERTGLAVLRTAVRRAADNARTTDDFIHALEEQGLLVRCRFSRLEPDQVTGYAVTLPSVEEPVWYAGGHIGAAYSLPRLQQRWNASRGDLGLPEDELTAEERQAFYDDAARAAAYATAEIRRYMAINPYAAEDACWAASDALRVAAKVTGNTDLLRAADAYDRAARAPYGRVPRPTSAGGALRAAAGLLTLGGVQNRTTVSILMLVSHLISLLETVAEIRRLQQRQAQADAARLANRHLARARLAAGGQPMSQFADAVEPSQARLAMAAFPNPWAPVVDGPAAGPASHSPHPGRWPRRSR